MNKKILYVGPSWARRSFDPTDENSDDSGGRTNLLKELGIAAKDLSKCGASNSDCIWRVRQEIEDYVGILWVYCEPLLDRMLIQWPGDDDDPITNLNAKRDLVTSEDFWAQREQENQKSLSMINDLGIPVGLIGGHSDIINCNYSNIEVIHSSWQKFLANLVGVDLQKGWGAEVAHREVIWGMRDCLPSKAFVNCVSDTLQSWTKMEMMNIFFMSHPNQRGNEMFAKEIQGSVQMFLNNL